MLDGLTLATSRTTVFSACRTYRYVLWRSWLGGDGYANIIGLNPSTADEWVDDDTIRRCIAFAKLWGCEALCVTNLFAFRATRPEQLKGAATPVGPDNDRYLVEMARGAAIVIAAWGCHGDHLGRAAVVRCLLPKLSYLKLNADGSPTHPLYLKSDLVPHEWS